MFLEGSDKCPTGWIARVLKLCSSHMIQPDPKIYAQMLSRVRFQYLLIKPFLALFVAQDSYKGFYWSSKWYRNALLAFIKEINGYHKYTSSACMSSLWLSISNFSKTLPKKEKEKRHLKMKKWERKRGRAWVRCMLKSLAKPSLEQFFFLQTILLFWVTFLLFRYISWRQASSLFKAQGIWMLKV